jgi:hypothetical protein
MENRLPKKCVIGDGSTGAPDDCIRDIRSRRSMVIRLVEQFRLSVKQTLARLDIHRSTFYAWLSTIKHEVLAHWRI